MNLDQQIANVEAYQAKVREIAQRGKPCCPEHGEQKMRKSKYNPAVFYCSGRIFGEWCDFRSDAYGNEV